MESGGDCKWVRRGLGDKEDGRSALTHDGTFSFNKLISAKTPCDLVNFDIENPNLPFPNGGTYNGNGPVNIGNSKYNFLAICMLFVV